MSYPIIPTRSIRLGRDRIEALHERMVQSQPQRYADWRLHAEDLETQRSYALPKLHDFYSRAEITSAEREALHVTRRVIEAVTRNSFEGSWGLIAEWTKVVGQIGLDSEKDSVIGQRSLDACLLILRENSYDNPAGMYSYIRTPMALMALERKYYMTDLLEY